MAFPLDTGSVTHGIQLAVAWLCLLALLFFLVETVVATRLLNFHMLR